MWLAILGGCVCVADSRRARDESKMPLADRPVVPSRYEDDDRHPTSSQPAVALPFKKSLMCRKPSPDDGGTDADVAESAPLSPRVRKRLDEAKENATVFGPGEYSCVIFKRLTCAHMCLALQSANRARSCNGWWPATQGYWRLAASLSAAALRRSAASHS
jgi:hypothetical protein